MKIGRIKTKIRLYNFYIIIKRFDKEENILYKSKPRLEVILYQNRDIL